MWAGATADIPRQDQRRAPGDQTELATRPRTQQPARDPPGRFARTRLPRRHGQPGRRAYPAPADEPGAAPVNGAAVTRSAAS